jgi:hypothetical protein
VGASVLRSRLLHLLRLRLSTERLAWAVHVLDMGIGVATVRLERLCANGSLLYTFDPRGSASFTAALHDHRSHSRTERPLSFFLRHFFNLSILYDLQ